MLNASGHGLKDLNRAREMLWSWRHSVVVDRSIAALVTRDEVEASGRYHLPCTDGSIVFPLLGYRAEIINGVEHLRPLDVSIMNPDERARVRRLG